jgi:hypothetical protein
MNQQKQASIFSCNRKRFTQLSYNYSDNSFFSQQVLQKLFFDPLVP